MISKLSSIKRSDVLLLALLILNGILVFKGSGLRPIEQSINAVQTHVQDVDKYVDLLIEQNTQLQTSIEATEVELAILRKERLILTLQAKRQKAKDWNELQEIKAQLHQAQQTKTQLLHLANQFDQ